VIGPGRTASKPSAYMICLSLRPTEGVLPAEVSLRSPACRVANDGTALLGSWARGVVSLAKCPWSSLTIGSHDFAPLWWGPLFSRARTLSDTDHQDGGWQGGIAPLQESCSGWWPRPANQLPLPHTIRRTYSVWFSDLARGLAHLGSHEYWASNL
jgi:hypothetical protein